MKRRQNTLPPLSWYGRRPNTTCLTSPRTLQVATRLGVGTASPLALEPVAQLSVHSAPISCLLWLGLGPRFISSSTMPLDRGGVTNRLVITGGTRVWWGC